MYSLKTLLIITQTHRAFRLLHFSFSRLPARYFRLAPPPAPLKRLRNYHTKRRRAAQWSHYAHTHILTQSYAENKTRSRVETSRRRGGNLGGGGSHLSPFVCARRFFPRELLSTRDGAILGLLMWRQVERYKGASEVVESEWI